MLFSSISFLYYFIPWAVILYYIVPKCLKNSMLLFVSLLFYGWGEPKYLIFLLAAITQGYIFGLLIEKYRSQKWSKVFLATSVLLCLMLLGCCKYADFFIYNFNIATGLSLPLPGIVLPLGISFYTFQILSYTIDVYRGEVSAQKNYIDLAAYIAMFPQLIAGPVVRYSEIAVQLSNRRHSMEDAADGIRRFVIGLSKKILVANVLGELVAVFKASGEKSVLFFWIYAVACTLQIYFDFSGYSDMAIGLGRIFGFRFSENFQYPYVSGSITEFWRRWHISLGTWFRDYLYIPMGGNRVSRPHWILNIFIVWTATGFWHGAAWNFLLWGVMFAVLLIVEKLWLLKLLEKQKIWNHIYVMFFVIVGFVIFDASGITEACSHLSAMFGIGNLSGVTCESLYYLKSYGVILFIAIIGATPLPRWSVCAVKHSKYGKRLMDMVEPVALIVLLAVCTAFLIDGSFNPFLYFRF